MNGIDRIKARLISDAQAEIEQLSAETAAACGQIAAEYEQKAQAEYWRIVKEGTKDCEAHAERLASAADMEARKSVLAFKQEMVGKAFSDAIDKLVNMPKAEYTAFLASLASNAAVCGTEELVFSPRDAAAVGEGVAKAANALLKEKGIKGGLTVSDETRDIPGGLIVRQGDIEVNCAIDTIVDLSRNELSAQVAEILFA